MEAGGEDPSGEPNGDSEPAEAGGLSRGRPRDESRDYPDNESRDDPDSEDSPSESSTGSA